MRRHLWWIVLSILVLLQVVPVDRSNPPAVADITAPAEVVAVLQRACWDCHSNHTRWPWYSRVAPASWLVAHDVHEAREELNFSEWGRMPERDREHAIRECWEKVSEGEMPPWAYRLPHAAARLDEDARRVFQTWAAGVPAESEEDGEHDDGEGTHRHRHSDHG